MTGIPYIKDLFKAILDSSKAIEGRFHLTHKYGAQEINTDTLSDLLSEIKFSNQKQVPFMAMVPPHSLIKPSNMKGEWEKYRIITFWVKNSYIEGTGQAINPNPKTKTSLHRVDEDWHDMKRCALNFLRVLDTVMRASKPPMPFRLPPNQALIIPFSNVGANRYSGVKVDFDFEINIGCDEEDYIEYPTNITISLDSHPEHPII